MYMLVVTERRVSPWYQCRWKIAGYRQLRRSGYRRLAGERTGIWLLARPPSDLSSGESRRTAGRRREKHGLGCQVRPSETRRHLLPLPTSGALWCRSLGSRSAVELPASYKSLRLSSSSRIADHQKHKIGLITGTAVPPLKHYGHCHHRRC